MISAASRQATNVAPQSSSRASGWASAKILFFFGLALVALIVFLAWEPRRDDPLIDPRFFRSAPFSGATITAVTITAALGGFLFLNTLYLQDVRGFRALTGTARSLSQRRDGNEPERTSACPCETGITSRFA